MRPDLATVILRFPLQDPPHLQDEHRRRRRRESIRVWTAANDNMVFFVAFASVFSLLIYDPSVIYRCRVDLVESRRSWETWRIANFPPIPPDFFAVASHVFP
ncbi:hypothetical protein KIN20_027517 [Parelaphostrongylus tenuis]|uniref:Uncharacterized protein n=1 Tax=Parelaphostrongylus tenuis TaxID=148309 RepID=A0AAD5QZU3_PARTN|nr:hypothetical protein KIN20_027517 [Parelaphostrongylus tenuis]